ncbi:hypothetical protein E3N88_45968 [Mikania micrantha]|uniref:Uncharacterized protein n=1 Tax=Mikania micrantha TaxID=192012 RepID=A0A5N6L8A0_9ASTR|nr:hypothetical protein E3N88_45968 [Mikania micrantha]
MRHMEMYMGNHIRSWYCGFPKDEESKKAKCNLLRKKYACKMITSDINKHKEMVLQEAIELDDSTDNRIKAAPGSPEKVSPDIIGGVGHLVHPSFEM